MDVDKRKMYTTPNREKIYVYKFIYLKNKYIKDC